MQTDPETWRKTLAIEKNGTVVFGSIADMIAKIRNGADMRIQLGSDMFYEPQKAIIRVRGGQSYICFRTAFIVSMSSWDTFVPEGIWNFTNACTDGKVYVLQQYLGDSWIIRTKVLLKAATWFTREMSCAQSNPVYCNDKTRQPTCQDQVDLLRAIQQGASIKIVDPKHVTSCSRIEFEHSDTSFQITCQYPWIPSLKLCPSDSFAQPSYWIFMLFSTTGHFVTTRYYIGSHTRVFDRTSTLKYNWFVDREWTLVYKVQHPTPLRS